MVAFIGRIISQSRSPDVFDPVVAGPPERRAMICGAWGLPDPFEQPACPSGARLSLGWPCLQHKRRGCWGPLRLFESVLRRTLGSRVTAFPSGLSAMGKHTRSTDNLAG